MLNEKKKYYLRDDTKDFHTKRGVLKVVDFKSGKVRNAGGEEYYVLEPDFIDRYKQMRRGPQVITLKDLGVIAAKTGIGKESIVLEAGGGSGGATFFLAHLAGKVTSYENRKEFFEILKENKKTLGVKNVELKEGDVGEFKGKVDMILLDLPNPWDYIRLVDSLGKGKFLVVYNNNIIQTQKLIEKIREREDLIFVETIELLERKWKVEGEIVRPSNVAIGHTGFISFVRKVK